MLLTRPRERLTPGSGLGDEIVPDDLPEALLEVKPVGSSAKYHDKLNELNTEGVEPLLHMTDAINVLREDEVKGSISREEALKNAPDTDGTFFRVPKVIKKQE